MESIKRQDIIEYVEQNIPSFHENRLSGLQGLKLINILRRKNPYLFKAKNIDTAEALIKTLLEAHLSSSEEGMFGTFLEGLAIFVCHQTLGGRKSTSEGIDLEFDREEARCIVALKFGPNWGNSSQIARMKDNFNRAKRILRTNSSFANVIAVNGCCYGKDDHPDKGDYLKLCGQRFWEFISSDRDLYIDIVEPLGYKSQENNQQFESEYSKVINKFTLEFLQQFCDSDGQISWERLVELNSAMGY